MSGVDFVTLYSCLSLQLSFACVFLHHPPTASKGLELRWLTQRAVISNEH